MAACYLTTVNNDYDPSVDLDAWWREDQRLGYDCCGKLARVTAMFGWSDDLSEERQSAIIEDAIDYIVDNDPFHIYRKVKVEDKPKSIDVLENKEKDS